MENPSYSSTWSWEQEKAFENALAIHGDDNMSDKWEKIAAEVPGKTVEDIKKHYDILVEDIEAIESGRVPLPCYESSPEGSADLTDEGANGDRGKKGVPSGSRAGDSSNGGKASKSENERRKGIAWTEDEHRLFLLGLDKYGKGDWRSISRNFVITRTPTQVASHAQKYFIRLNSMNKDRRRSSIHDITTVGSGDTPAHQGPITGQTGMAVASSKSGKPSSHPPPGPPGVGVYGTPTLGQPIGGPLVSAVGTPVNPHMAYGLRAPIAGTVVPGAPVNIPSGTYPMPHTSTPR